MKKAIGMTALAALMLCFAVSSYAEGRLNFMLINLTGQDITDVQICPTNYPQYQSENLLKTALGPQSHIYIGPNYYGEQTFWNIAVKWANGHEQTFTKLRLTRYNTYTLYATPQGVKIRQTYDPKNAHYAFGPEAPSYMGLKPEVKVNATAPQKLDAVPNLPVDLKAEPGKTQPAKGNLTFADSDKIAETAVALKTSAEVTREGKNISVNPRETFKTGDKIKLNFATNKDGHIYWVKKSGDNNYQLLYPSAKDATGSSVSGNKVYSMPSSEPLQFDASGSEIVFAILSPNEVDALKQAVQLQAEGKNAEASKLVSDYVKNHEQKNKAEEIVIEEEDEEDVNMQSRLADGELVREYEFSVQ